MDRGQLTHTQLPPIPAPKPLPPPRPQLPPNPQLLQLRAHPGPKRRRRTVHPVASTPRERGAHRQGRVAVRRRVVRVCRGGSVHGDVAGGSVAVQGGCLDVGAVDAGADCGHAVRGGVSRVEFRGSGFCGGGEVVCGECGAYEYVSW